MIYFVILGFAMAGVVLLALAEWRERSWPREGHGESYFAPPNLRH